ncbi:hypothetical protein BGZ99_006826, partial [Dissophora globulifera]
MQKETELMQWPLAHVGRSDAKGIRPQGHSQGRWNSGNETYSGNSADAYGWFDETPQGPPSRSNNNLESLHPPRQQQRQQQHSGQSAKRGSGRQPPQKGQNKQNLQPERDLYDTIKEPRPMIDNTWKRFLPPDDFRFLSVFPTDMDVNVEEFPDPPENIVHKAYDSTEQYIETHFQLLRADCIIPVRDAIRLYRFGAVDDNEMMVYKHNPRDLRIGIKFLSPDPAFDFNPDISYTMIEAMQGYFEAYRHVLKCLQDIDPATLPFQPQLVGLEPELEQPVYSRNIPDLWDREYIKKSVLEFPDILKSDDFPPRRWAANEERTVANPTTKDVKPNILNAMEHLLTKEFAVMQGPPGTGKTFLGLLATRILLENCRTSATGPIVVICQTNHALDQFLEGIMKFEDRVVRLGSRSKSEIVAPRTLFNIRMDYKDNPDKARSDGISTGGPVRFFKFKGKLEAEMLALLEQMSVEYVPLEKLLELKIITQTQFDSFAYDGWVTRFDQEENPTAEPWLQAAPHIQDPNEISLFDDASLRDDIVPEIDEEELQERVEEFNAGNIDESRVMGRSVEVKKSIVCHVDDLVVGDIKPYLRMPNVHDIPGQKRMGVYKHWLQKYHATLSDRLGKLHTIFNLVCENIRAEFRHSDASILRTARVIGMTTTAASKYHDLLCLLKPKIMICEEASETLEAHLLSALTPSVEHFLLIGDHEQLRPSMSVNDLKLKNIDVSLFERLVRNDFPFAALDCQRRMRPEIRSLIRPIYPRLKDHESVCNYDNVRGMVDNLWFLTHSEPDQLGPNNSHFNPHEVGVAARLAIYLLQQGYSPSEITILAMYSGQRNKIMERLRQSSALGTDRIRVSTVDGFQGEENEVIILSLVRSNENNSIGFLKTSNRVCVSLSRAKK